ncbi:MAG TPA: hypothetical protein PKY05_14180, partial [Fibrobacteria bacterium]|nr:hypothetical protein [Fibrobacteria bacterium]
MRIHRFAPLSILACASLWTTACNQATATDEDTQNGTLPTAELAAARVSAEGVLEGVGAGHQRERPEDEEEGRLDEGREGRVTRGAHAFE